jgi:hypothetical protein
MPRTSRVLLFLPERIRHALATVQTLAHVCDDGLLTAFPTGYLADRTGGGRPDRLHALWPGSGGRAANAGAQSHAVWDSQNRVFGHGALPPWNIPAQHGRDHGIACAHKGALFRFDLGSCPIHALARLATAGASCCTRLHPPPTLAAPRASGRHHVALPQMRQGGEGTRIERALFLGATERGPARLVAVRMPESIVNARRRSAKKKAKKTGDRPAKQ